jgi:hypothetical protein
VRPHRLPFVVGNPRDARSDIPVLVDRRAVAAVGRRLARRQSGNQAIIGRSDRAAEDQHFILVVSVERLVDDAIQKRRFALI